MFSIILSPPTPSGNSTTSIWAQGMNFSGFMLKNRRPTFFGFMYSGIEFEIPMAIQSWLKSILSASAKRSLPTSLRYAFISVMLRSVISAAWQIWSSNGTWLAREYNSVSSWSDGFMVLAIFLIQHIVSFDSLALPDS